MQKGKSETDTILLIWIQDASFMHSHKFHIIEIHCFFQKQSAFFVLCMQPGSWVLAANSCFITGWFLLIILIYDKIFFYN